MKANELGGGALGIGCLVLLVLLFRNPVAGFDAATVSVPSTLYFLVLPTTGFFVGIYAYIGGSYSAVPLFLLGSYLGIFGLSLILGSALSTDPVGITLGAGVIISVLSLVALVASVLQSLPSVELDSPRSSSD